jgi:hypothetical protein
LLLSALHFASRRNERRSVFYPGPVPDRGIAFMPPETEVISCPACNHLLRVPLDWLGQPVQCPECKAMFKAPVRDGDSLTRPELISRPTPAAPPGARKKLDAMLLLPAFGLLFCGVAGLIVNGMLTYKFLADPVGSKQYIKNQMPNFREHGLGADDPPEERERLDDERADKAARTMRWVLPVFAGVSALALLGGLSIALRWNYRLAQVGCVAAAINVPHFCCVPGSVAGMWGLLMLSSDEGRAHFGK